ncbi:MAG: hypothetical protein B6D61_13150, partial [Bacteroidetes bacterium 4484_249]
MYNLEKTIEFEVKKYLYLECNTENIGINLIGKKETNTAKIKVKILLSKKDINENLIITDFDKEENRLYVDFTKFEGKDNILKADITIEVPLECRSKIKSENGKVSLSNLIGEQSIISENGPVKAENIEGNINIKTENSMIKISSVIGNITCETENSMIKIS